MTEITITPEFEEAAKRSKEYFEKISQDSAAIDKKGSAKRSTGMSFAEFKDKYGFLYTETYNLDTSIAHFILPRLIYLRDNHNGYPYYFERMFPDNEEAASAAWNATLNEMIAGFKTAAEKELCDRTAEDQYNLANALQTFAKHYDALWD